MKTKLFPLFCLILIVGLFISSLFNSNLQNGENAFAAHYCWTADGEIDGGHPNYGTVYLTTGCEWWDQNSQQWQFLGYEQTCEYVGPGNFCRHVWCNGLPGCRRTGVPAPDSVNIG